MAFLSAQVSTVKRGLGQNAVASAAYNARTKLELTVLDKATGITGTLVFDYSSKPGLAHSKIYAPDHAPEWVYDREKLWNKCEQVENRLRARTAHKIMLPLPNELTIEQNIALLEDCVKELVKLGMIVDANIHYDNENNKHAHLMCSMRELVENRYGEIEFAATKNRDWHHKNFVNFVRQMHAEKVNEHYAMHGYDKRFCHKSYKDLRIDLIPGVHEGPARSINNAELSELNRQIAAENAEKIKAKPSIILDVLAVNNPVFTKEQIAIELEKRLYAGVDFTRQTDIESIQKELSSTFISLYEKILVCPEISQVTEVDLKGRALYTTTKRLELEERFTETVRVMNNRNNHALGVVDSDLDHLSFSEKIGAKVRDIKSDAIDFVNKNTGLDLEKPKQSVVLTAEQRKAVINVLNGSDISVLEGIPGSGKTTAMQEIVRQYKKAGYTVIGAAPSSSASLELAKATGIECKNASLWRKEWLKAQGKEFDLVLRGDYYKEDLYKGNGPSLTKKHVMIVDEASMVELGNMDYLVSEARLGGAKILFVGDRNQLSPVGWAGGLEKTVSICGSEVLSQSRRQQNINHQQATKLLSQYRVREALDIYWKEGVIKVAENESEANSIAVRSFVNSYIEKARAIERDDLVSIRSKAITVFENKTREILNNQVREELKEAGILKGIEQRVLVGSTIKDGKKEKYYLNLCQGEQIVFTRNANRLGRGGIFNGEVGTILKISKPNEEGLSKIDILVHRANGTKEKVRLDLNEVYQNRFTGKYFHDGISIDYGYAITSHKVQGATIEDTIPRLEKNSGYEVTNVMLTRHKKEMTVIVSKEVLYDAFYESLDSTASKARNRFDLDSPEEETILKGGLAKMVSKRSNTSFASDYRTMGLLEEDKYIKDYLDKCEETITTIRKITSWQGVEQRKTGKKPQMWENKELWEEFKEARKERAHAASLIVSGFAPNGKIAALARADYENLEFKEYRDSCKVASYAKFKDRLIQLGMNYATVEKHASQMVKASELDKVIVNQKATILHDQDVFKELVQSVASGHTGEIRNSYRVVNSHIAETTLAIEEKLSEIENTESHRQELTDATGKEEHYRKILTPEYLNRIYRSKEGEENAGARSLKLYEGLVEEHGEEQATKMVARNPAILGELKGYGIGKFFGLNNDRKDAIALCNNLERQLNGFNRSGEMVEQYKEQMKEASFGEKIFALKEEIEHLRSLLPADIDNEFLKEVENRLQKTKGNNIDWRDLQKSELFETVRINQYLEKGSAVILDQENRFLEEQSVSSAVEIAKGQEAKEVVIAEKATDPLPTEGVKGHGNNLQGNNKPRLTFNDVKAGLNSTVVSEIFRKYGSSINPDDKVEQRGDQIKIGSLQMRITGDKMGLWKRFSEAGSGGDIFSFVEKATGCSKYESLEIVASHAGIVANTQDISSKYNRSAISKNTDLQLNTNDEIKDKNVWIPVETIPESAKAFNSKRDLAFLAKKGEVITHEHEYRNKDNMLLGYTLRIEDAAGRKQVLPVAYCHNDRLEKSAWRLSGFSDSASKPIYNLEKIAQNPDKPILIVEGEKTADSASKLMPDYTVISWMGGAQGVDKVDWSKLTNKLVSIWPDNDKPGILAAQKIANHIDCHNGFAGLVHIVDTEELGLPKKWDLADEIPKDSLLSQKSLNEIVDNTRLNTPSVGKRLALDQGQGSPESKVVANAIEMLIEQGRIEKDEYSSMAVYQRSISAIARVEGIDLGQVTDHQEFVKSVSDIQGEYQSLQRSYNLRLQQENKGLNTNSNNSELSGKDKLAQAIVRDVSILHQVELGQNKLTELHSNHIEKTVNAEIGKHQTIADSQQELIANNIFKTINSDEWRKDLDLKNQEKAYPIAISYTAKTIDEFLVGENNKDAKTCLEHIRQYGMDESLIVEVFKKDYASGVQELKGLSEKLNISAGFVKDHGGMLEEARSWGYEGDEREITKSVIGKDAEQIKEDCQDIRKNALNQYLKENLKPFEEKITCNFKLESLKPVMRDEQEFLKRTYESLKSPIEELGYINEDYLQAGKTASEKPEILEEVFVLANRLVKEANSQESRVAESLSLRKDMAKTRIFLSKQLEYNRCYRQPKALMQERLSEKTIESVFEVIKKEQDTFANMKGTIVHHDFSEKLMQKIELAHTQRESNELDRLKAIADQSLESGAKTKESLLKDLQNTTDLKASREKIGGEVESHSIKQNLTSFEIEKNNAKEPMTAMKVLATKQSYLSSVHEKLEYPQHLDKEVLNIIEVARQNKETNELDKLKAIADQSLESGAKTKESLLKDLQNTTDLKASREKIVGEIENHFIKQKLSSFEIEKNNAKEPMTVMKVLATKQSYLSSIHEKLEYPQHLDKEVLNIIEATRQDQQENRLENLNKLVSFVAGSKLYNNTEIINHLKEPKDLRGLTENLTLNYQNRYLQNIEQNLERIEKHGNVAIDKKIFDCPVKYLTYEQEHSHQDYTPEQGLKQLQDKTIRKQFEAAQATKTQEQEVDKGMDFER